MEQGSCHRHILSMSVDRTRKSSFVNQLVVQQNGVWVRDEDMEWYDSATSGNQNQAGAYQDCGTGQRARFGMSFSLTADRGAGYDIPCCSRKTWARRYESDASFKRYRYSAYYLFSLKEWTHIWFRGPPLLPSRLA